MPSSGNHSKLAVSNVLGESPDILYRGVLIERAINEQDRNVDGSKLIDVFTSIELEDLIDVEHDLPLVALNHRQQRSICPPSRTMTHSEESFGKGAKPIKYTRNGSWNGPRFTG